MKDYCKILGFAVFAEILTLFINVTLAFSSSVFFRIICSICTIGILTGLMAQAGYAIAVTDKKRLKDDPDAVKSIRPVFLGMTAVLPYLICWVLLLLAKLGMFPDGYYRIYKLLCAPFLQICNLFSTDVSALTFPLPGLCILAVCSLIPFAAVWMAYRFTIQGKSVEEMMYK